MWRLLYLFIIYATPILLSINSKNVYGNKNVLIIVGKHLYACNQMFIYKFTEEEQEVI